MFANRMQKDEKGQTALETAIILIAFVVVPLVANQYWFSAILIPFLILALAAGWFAARAHAKRLNRLEEAGSKAAAAPDGPIGSGTERSRQLRGSPFR